MIQTNKYSLSKQKYFQIILQNYVRRRIWLLAIILFLLVIGTIRQDIGPILFVVFFLVFIIFYFLWYAYSKKNILFFKERYFEIDNDFITG